MLNKLLSPQTSALKRSFSYEGELRVRPKDKIFPNKINKDYNLSNLIENNVTEKLGKVHKLKSKSHRFSVVLEGRKGVTSVAEICKREKIDQATFLDWSKEWNMLHEKKLSTFDKVSDKYFENRSKINNLSTIEVFEYLSHYIDFTKNTDILKEKYCLEQRIKFSSNIIVNFEKVNNIRYINKYFEWVNNQLKRGDIFVGCLETLTARRERKSIGVPVFNNVYFAGEFFFKRILSKVSFTKKFYFDFTKGNDRLLSKAEGLGRLVSCGFKIMDYKNINGLVYFVVKKEREPHYNMNPSYGPLYKMPRLGKGGKIIGVYKLRTMHPYSEYLQDYIIKAHGYSSTGKPANDFRVPEWGKIMRKFWLDELPQLINFFKGEIKLVGIRPVSERYFQDIPKEMKKLRLTQKPGCIPPYVALNREGNVMSVLQAEKEYLEEKIRNPFTTDIKYFFLALYNIIVNNKRSA